MRLNRVFTAALYCVVTLLVVLPAVDTLLAMLPAHPATLTWRFGAEGVVASNLITPIFGWALLLALLLARGHRRTLRALSGVSFAAATVLLMVALLAVLDALQLRAQVRPDRLLRFDIAGLETLGKTSLVSGTLILLALGGWKASRKQKTRAESVDPIVFAGHSTSGSPPARDTPSSAVAHPSA